MKDETSKNINENGTLFLNWVENYFNNLEEFPVLANVKPGDIKKQLPINPPEKSESYENIISDLTNIILPGVTHWNHPKFMAYFNSTSSDPGIFAELVSAAFNTNGMLWKSNPASTELEEVTLNWFRKMLGLSDNFWGIIYDLASSSTMHAIVAARENLDDYAIREKGFGGVQNKPRLRLYASEQAHSSIEKGAIVAGIGLEGVRKIKVDENFRMIPKELEKAIAEDKLNGWKPFCVVATVGTTSTTSIDPVGEISKICKTENIWLHVDAAHAGVAAIVPEMKFLLDGVENADSVVVNPHKWMFTPVDLSVLFTKHKGILKQAFSLIPEYLKTDEDNEVTNFMDYGIQLGRRFRSLKLWFIIRHYGTEGIIEIIREHLRLGKMFSNWIVKNPNFELLAPTPLSTICFRAIPQKPKTGQELNIFNKTLMDNVNATGKAFLSHTVLNGKFTIRVVISGIRTEEIHVKDVFELINAEFEKISND
ncbi:MAG: amino acid decarboxylase [Bacteroidetes bacterium]|nr:amino acid decarboxylase [Bacteroidota bacterium]MBU1113728.1 amino acid decarboxylase [Bacteroidota bacterium]MBU1799372.1 amino acid decarboxylase [Bacteroidota bacterium]